MTYEEKKAYEEAYLRKFLENGRGLHTESLEYVISELTKELENRKKIKREALRQELMENLQKAIGDILHNDFCLTIKNTETDPIYDDCHEVCFDTEDIYSVEIIDTKQRQRYFFKLM